MEFVISKNQTFREMNTEHIAKKMLRDRSQSSPARLEKLLAIVLQAKHLFWIVGLAFSGLLVFGAFAFFGLTFLSRGRW